jgi:hypothetical protein
MLPISNHRVELAKSFKVTCGGMLSDIGHLARSNINNSRPFTTNFKSQVDPHPLHLQGLITTTARLPSNGTNRNIVTTSDGIIQMTAVKIMDDDVLHITNDLNVIVPIVKNEGEVVVEEV